MNSIFDYLQYALIKLSQSSASSNQRTEFLIYNYILSWKNILEIDEEGIATVGLHKILGYVGPEWKFLLFACALCMIEVRKLLK